MAKNLYNPGQNDAPGGEYIEVDSHGKEVKNAREVTIESGDRLPPTQESDNKWMQK